MHLPRESHSADHALCYRIFFKGVFNWDPGYFPDWSIHTQSPRVSVHEYETIWNCMEMPSEQTDMETKICTHSVTIRDQIKTKPQKSVDLEGNISSYGKKIIFWGHSISPDEFFKTQFNDFSTLSQCLFFFSYTKSGAKFQINLTFSLYTTSSALLCGTR